MIGHSRTHWKKVTLKHSLKTFCQNREVFFKTVEEMPDCFCVLELWRVYETKKWMERGPWSWKIRGSFTVAVKWNYRSNLFVSQLPFTLWVPINPIFFWRSHAFPHSQCICFNESCLHLRVQGWSCVSDHSKRESYPGHNDWFEDGSMNQLESVRREALSKSSKSRCKM